MNRILVAGAGPAGLTAAYELARGGARPILLEKTHRVGGISRTNIYKGYYFDIGGHRFFTKNKRIIKIWKDTLGPDLLRVIRNSRVYYQNRLFKYPLSLPEALLKLGPIEGIKILGSYAGATLRSNKKEENLEQWLINHFGERLYKIFFKSYTEKVWGTPCNMISSEWSAQRIRGLSLTAAFSPNLKGTGKITTLIHEFLYPSKGSGMMWERLSEKISSLGGDIWPRAELTGIRHRNGKILSANILSGDTLREIPCDFLISSMPLPQLVEALDPPAPVKVCKAARSLRYRAFVLVGLIVRNRDLFPDQWIYIHSPDVRVGRIQNFKNWSAKMVPDIDKTSLGMEYFCNEGDEIWSAPDLDLLELATCEVRRLKLSKVVEVEDGVVVRQPMAYPVYDWHYKDHLATLKEYLDSFFNLQTIGRNGMHRYNNMDHSMLTGLLAAKQALGIPRNPWEINEDPSYLEDGACSQD